MSNCQLLVRPRLIELLAQRWARRVVCVIAGPGFGKSVLLAQAARENRLDLRGTEITVVCDRHDGAPASFLRRLARADHMPGRATSFGAEALVAQLARHRPEGVCIVIDDVHHLIATDAGTRLLQRLVTAAPPAVHFVLVGRRAPQGFGALRASGDLLDIGEADLTLDGPEREELARLHSVDPTDLDSTGGWPAVAAVAASCGIDRARDLLEDTLREHTGVRQRWLLAVAAAIGPCDRDLLLAAAGTVLVDDGELDGLTEVPMVARRDGLLAVHDLWHGTVGGALGTDERCAVVARAAATLTERGEYARAHRLCAEHQLWDAAAQVLRACCSRGHPEVPSDVLVEWLDTLPAGRRDDAAGLLLRGLVGRVLDPFGPHTADVLERAVACHRAGGDVIGEITAINELAFVLRNQGRSGEVMQLVVRAAELRAAGHRGVDGLLAMARSVCAELAGDTQGLLTAVDEVQPGTLSRDWRAAFAFRRTIAHLTLGDEHQMLEAAIECVELAGDSTLRHVQALARWFAGDPQPALDALGEVIADADRSKVDGVALGAFATMVLATTGRIDDAKGQLAITERAASGGPVVPMMSGYLIGIRALVAAASGDDDSAREALEAALQEHPLADPVGWLAATRWLVLAYVLLPAARADINAAELGPLHAKRVAIARAVVAARSGSPIDDRSIATLTVAEIATAVPLPWSMELAARLSGDGRRLGRNLAEWCMQRSGRSARDALRAAATHADATVSSGARKLLAAIPLAPSAVRLDLLGPTVLNVRDDSGPEADWQRERVRSLLIYLVLHGPSRREAITDAVWPGLDPTMANRNLRVTLAYLQRVLEPDRRKGEAPFIVRQEGPALVLAGPPHLSTDLAEFEHLLDDAEAAYRRGVPSVARELYGAALAMWRGPCLADVAFEEWAQPTRQALTGRFVAAAVRAAELSLVIGDVAAARRDALRALAADGWCEPAHRLLIASSLHTGDRASAARAVIACEEMLGHLGVDPDPMTMALIRQIRAPAIYAVA